MALGLEEDRRQDASVDEDAGGEDEGVVKDRRQRAEDVVVGPAEDHQTAQEDRPKTPRRENPRQKVAKSGWRGHDDGGGSGDLVVEGVMVVMVLMIVVAKIEGHYFPSLRFVRSILLLEKYQGARPRKCNGHISTSGLPEYCGTVRPQA